MRTYAQSWKSQQPRTIFQYDVKKNFIKPKVGWHDTLNQLLGTWISDPSHACQSPAFSMTCGTVMSDSLALDILLAAKTRTWVPGDLDICVLYRTYHYLVVLLGQQGHHLIQGGQINHSPYSLSLVRKMNAKRISPDLAQDM